MRLDRAFQLSTVLLAAIAFVGLAMTADLQLGFLLLGSTGLVASAVQVLRLEPGGRVPSSRLSTPFWNVLIVLAFAWFWIDFLWFTQDLLGAGVHFLITLMVNKLFNLQLRRDYLQLYAISLMMVLASAGMTSDLWYGTIVVAYLLAGVWTLLLYQLYMEHVSAWPGLIARHEPDPALRSIDARFFWTTNTFALLAFALTLLIFFSIPGSAPDFSRKTGLRGSEQPGSPSRSISVPSVRLRWTRAS